MKSLPHCLFILSYTFILMGCSHNIQQLVVKEKIDLGTLGGASSKALDISPRGVIVGESQLANGKVHAFAYRLNVGGMQDLGTLPGGNTSSATGINSQDQIVGHSEVPYSAKKTALHAFYFEQGEMADLGTYVPSVLLKHSDAIAINSVGQVAGRMEDVPVIWDLKGESQLPPYPPARQIKDENNHGFPGSVEDINTFNMATGRNYSTDKAYRFANGSYEQLRSVGYENIGYAINNTGKVVGTVIVADDSGSFHKAVRWWTPNVLVYLGTLGGKSSEARDINDSNLIVGFSETAQGNTHAFVWHAEYGMRDLGTLGGKNSRAFAINNNGQIVGESETPNGEMHAVMWVVDYGQ